MNLRPLLFGLFIVSTLFSQTTTITGDLRVKKHIRVDSLANDSTMMVVADTLGRFSVLPIPGGSSNVPGNPTGTVGLSAVNGSNTTYMRSDAAPALSQAIVPTWTGAHTFSAATTFGGAITTPLTASRLLTVNASSQLAVNAALTANGFLYATGAGGIASTAAAGNGQILIGSTGVAPVLGTLSGTANQISVSQGAGTLGLSIPNTLVVPDSLNVGALTGADTRMVVAGADGGLFTQTIPEGSSLGNPTATIGLTAVNGSATSGMRADGAPALSQAIAPTWTSAHIFNNNVSLAGVTANQVAYSNGSGVLSGSGNLTWNGTTLAITGDGSYSGTLTATTGMNLSWLNTARVPFIGASGAITSSSNLTYTTGTNTFATANGSFSGTVVVTGDATLAGLLHVSNALPEIRMTDAGGGDIFSLQNDGGDFSIRNNTDAANIIRVLGSGNSVQLNGATAVSGLLTGAAHFLTSGTSPAYRFDQTSAATDERLWDIQAASGQLVFRTRTDVNGTGATWLAVDRTGTTVDAVTLPILAGSGTRMVVADASGAVSTQSIPAAGSLANPTATIGLTAVNGSATSGMRSDGAPALSQAIVPTWTGLHTFSTGLAVTGGSIAPGSITYSGANGTIITGGDGGTGNDFLLLNSDLGTVAYVPNGDTKFVVDKLKAEDLAGSGTRMVVVDAVGDMSTQTIPAGASLANPTGTIGLTAVNGSATSGMRSDGAPALSQAIAPTWTGAHSFTAGFSAHSGSSNGQSFLAGGSSTNNAADGGWIMLSGAAVNTMAGYVEIRAGTTTGTQDTGTVRIWPSAGGSTRFGRVDDGNRWATHVQGDLKVDDSLVVLGRLGHGATVKYIDTIASTTIPLNTADLITITLTGDNTYNMETGAASGRHITFRVHQDGTGGHNITWGTMFAFPSSGEPTQSTSPDSWSYYSFMYNEIENTWDYVGGALGFGGT